MHWRRKWQPTPVFLPGESQGRGSLGGLPSVGSHRVGHDWRDVTVAAAAESSAALQLRQLETLQSTFAGGAGGSLGPQVGSSMSQPSSLLCWERAGAVCRVGVGQRAQQLQLHEVLAFCWSVWTCGCGGRAPQGWLAVGIPPERDAARVCVCTGHLMGCPQVDPAVLTNHTAVQRKHRRLLLLCFLFSPHWG